MAEIMCIMSGEHGLKMFTIHSLETSDYYFGGVRVNSILKPSDQRLWQFMSAVRDLKNEKILQVQTSIHLLSYA